MNNPFFKNLLTYRLSRDVIIVDDNDTAELAQKLEAFRFTPCGSQDFAKAGWVPPMDTLSDQLFHLTGGQLLLVIRRDEKILPKQVITEELNKKIAKLEAQQSRTTTLKTIRNQLSFLRSALDEAVTDGVLQLNPVSLVTASRYQSDKSTADSDYIVDPLSPAEVDALLSSAGNKQWENLFMFAIQTGMRSSELCALRWRDIDFIGKTAHVQNASVVGVIKGTKTKAGTRKVELNDVAMAVLANQKTFTFMKDATIFEDPKTNKPWASADAIRKKAWVPTLRKAGIRYRNPYQTRHTFATRHISQGANLFWLAGQMGHKGPEMLFRHYGSYLKEYDGNTERRPLLASGGTRKEP